MKTISIVAPCFNEEAVLPEFFARLTAAAESWGMPFEVVCVDDGSSDQTWELLRAQQARDPRWRGLSFARNFGHQAAVSAGLRHAGGDAVLIVDADLQDPPEEMHRLVEKWREGHEVVYLVQTARTDGAVKRVLAWGFYRVMARMAPFAIPNDSGDCCLLDRRVVDALNAMPERRKYLRGLRAWCGFSQVGVPIVRHARAAGSPKYNLRKSFGLAMDGIFAFSMLPLRLVSWLGLAVMVLALAGVGFTILRRLFPGRFALFGPEPNLGVAAIVLSILFLGGIQLLCLGILGEYLGRIYDEVKGRPPWIIRDSAGMEIKASGAKSA
jgi:dolichol-phosphate mannosyltransferase